MQNLLSLGNTACCSVSPWAEEACGADVEWGFEVGLGGPTWPTLAQGTV